MTEHTSETRRDVGDKAIAVTDDCEACNACGDREAPRVNIGEYDYNYGAATVCRGCLVVALALLDAGGES